MAKDLITILSEMTNSPVQVLKRQHLSKQKMLQKIIRASKKAWGQEWDIELTRYYQIDHKCMFNRKVVEVTNNTVAFGDCMHAFTFFATHLPLLDVTNYSTDIQLSHVVVSVSDRFMLSVPNIINSFMNPVSAFFIHVFKYTTEDPLMRFKNEFAFCKCAPTDGVPLKRFHQLGGHVGGSCGYTKTSAVSIMGVTTDEEMYRLICMLFLDLPFNPSGKGWASPTHQHQMCISNGIQFKGNAMNSWSACLGRGANDSETCYESSIGNYVHVVDGRLKAIRDLPAGLPLGILRGVTESLSEGKQPTHRSLKKDYGFFASDTEDNFLRHVKTSSYMVRANVYVFSPAPEIFIYCVGKRNVRSGSGLYYNGRVIRQKHNLYCS